VNDGATHCFFIMAHRQRELIRFRFFFVKHIDSMSFDKGHWRAENRAILELEIPCVILPKLGTDFTFSTITLSAR